MNRSKMDELLGLLAEDKASSMDKSILTEMIVEMSEEELKVVMDEYQRKLISSNAFKKDNVQLNDLIKNRIYNYEKSRKKSRYLGLQIAATISILVVFIIFIQSYYHSKERFESQDKISLVNTEMEDKATTSISSTNGKIINIDSLPRAQWHIVDGAELRITDSIGIEYTGIKTRENHKSSISHTIHTPIGKIVDLVLPDKTKVRLNASSSITFPLVFDEENRAVMISGEVFFDVAKQKDNENRSKPFVVYAKNQKVVVLGTQFNISAYPSSDKIETTLIEGTVHVITPKSDAIMKPGQQVVVDREGNLEEMSNLNIDESISWRQENFSFNGKSIHESMGEISKWYDVEVVYEGEISSDGFGGNISKNKELPELLRLLNLANVVGLNLENDTIKVYSK